jgi:pimeloyl-ACP methyl ester carboxylesterase
MSDRTPTFLVLCVLLCLAAGCSPDKPALPADLCDKPLVISLGGVGGETVGADCLRDGLASACGECQVVAWPWSRGLEGVYLLDLCDLEGNRRRAAELARQIEAFRAARPETPITLVGHSGGTAIAVFALEELAPEVQVEDVVLLGPALSPEYNLAPALRHVRGHLLSTCSAADVVLLGAGTRTFGTMDRRYQVAAGHDGLRLPPDASVEDREQYRKVLQARWNWSWLLRGHYGGHFMWSTPWFAEQYVAPLVTRGDVPLIFEPLTASAR